MVWAGSEGGLVGFPRLLPGKDFIEGCILLP